MVAWRHLSRSNNLYSDIQRADDIEFILPNEAREKFFEYEEKVKLVNARITVEGYKIEVKLTTSFPFQFK